MIYRCTNRRSTQSITIEVYLLLYNLHWIISEEFTFYIDIAGTFVTGYIFQRNPSGSATSYQVYYDR